MVSKRRKRLVIFNYSFLHYHIARCKAAYEMGKTSGWDVKIYYGKPNAMQFPMPNYGNLLEPHSIQAIEIESDQASSYQKMNVGRQTIEFLERDVPDAIAILGYNTRMDWTALNWCRKNRKGAILMSESQVIDYHRSFIREQAKRVVVSLFDSALVGGKPHVSYATKLGLSPERVFTGYDVVDNTFWAEWAERVRLQPDSWQQRLNLPKHFFLTACRLVPKKNITGLLQAYANYTSQEQSPWPLVIAGDGPLRSELESLAQSLGITSDVHFLGYLSADEMGPIYGLASVFILASAYSEQWGLVVNEAMSAGLPVLVSNICGCVPDLVIDSVTGYAFDPTDETKLAVLMKRCSSGELDLRHLGVSAKEHMKAYTPQVFAKNILSAAEAAISHAHQRRLKIWPFPFI